VAPDDPRWLWLLRRAGVLRASDEELGDIREEYAGGRRTRSWLLLQILSTIPRRRPHVTFQEEGNPEMLSTVANDVRYVLRTFRRNPGFAVAAIAPIALGIGINTGVFSILNNVMFRPVPAPMPNELVTVYQEFQGVQKRRVHGARIMFSLPEYHAYRDASQTLSGLTAYTKTWTVTLGGRSPEEVEGVLVGCNYFDVLQLRPVIGPGFTEANCEASNAPPTVVLSHALWTRVFAADPDIIRKSVMLNGQSVAVVGVAPEGFAGTELAPAAFFAPVSLQPAFYPERNFLRDPQTSWLTLLARRHASAGIEQVRAELGVIAGRLDRQQPGRSTTLLISPASSLSLPVARRDFMSAAALVLAAFGLILLIACANVANVLLARGAARSREIAVRLAVGATRARLVRLLLTESAIIALIGGAAGSLLAWWSFRALLPSLVLSLPGMAQSRLDAHPDLTVLWFGIALTVVTAMASGLVPALTSTKQAPHAVIKQQGAQWKDRAGGWLRSAFISIQVAVCMVLLIFAALLLRALHAAYTLDPGFESSQVAVVSLDLRGPRFDNTNVGAFRKEMLERLRTLRGVISVAEVGKVPLSPGRMQTTFRLPEQEQPHEFDMNTVSPEYFSLVRIPIVSGRTFTRAELDGDARAAIVSEATARRLWPDQDPVGGTLVAGSNPDQVLEIVGVAKDARVSHVPNVESSYVYLPAGASSARGLAVLVRSHTNLDELSTSIRAAVQTLDAGLLPRVRPLDANLEYWRQGSRTVATLAGSLSALALVLAAVGVYGVVSYLVTCRRREVGIRMALGATSRAVQALILRETFRPVGAGVLAGAAGAAASSQVLASRLFGISPLDPVAFAGAAVFLMIVATMAILVPTITALKVDPTTTLRHD